MTGTRWGELQTGRSAYHILPNMQRWLGESPNMAENVRQVMFDCLRFTPHYTRLEAAAESRLPPENIEKFKLESTKA